ncbi:hypothetical protein DYU05_00310 [Mucilaginibacter terrenus]|uniref:Glycoside hydrolase family 97 protein n=1 Tax=Mucilaginibacter terrenus TaxID=2482727 RepID=A0A3E2NSX8_9SPHI|nr:glycoside hydrolase family 97 protein [Mucilaginibacter terrenus]RFZ84116.1 hypothetical protein DYU05_00310 [Mucilaginibacter terrenus]
MISFLQRALLIAAFTLAGYSIHAQVARFTIKSPDNKISATFFNSNGALYYKVQFKGQAVIEPSAMGLVVDSSVYAKCKPIHPSKIALIRNTFAWRGVHSLAQHHANSSTIKIMSDDKSKADWAVDVQVFNNGVAFRYNIPHNGVAEVSRELTEFTVPAQSAVWWQGDIHNYEGEYTRSQPSAIKKGQPIGMPLTLVLPNNFGYAAVTEAGINNFAGAHLVAGGFNSFYTALEGNVKLSGSTKTPWRVISIGQNLNELVNADIVASLSDKPDAILFPQGFNTPWIKPGKSVWSWMTANRAVTPENMRKFSDLAAQCGIPYNLVDDGWGKWREPGKDQWQILKDLVDYSAAKNVKIWVWAAYPDNNGLPGLRDSVYLKTFLTKCHEMGVAGVKIDFMSSESQNVMAFYERACREAARLKLMIDFHGAGKPSGQSRTWPNELTREAVRGLEYSDDTDWPTHNTIIPFTRYLAGPGDYTPLSTAKFVSNTTLAHQVATVVTFTSPFLCLGVDPADLLKSEALPFVRAIPSVWDETIVLQPSAIGEVCVMARRSGTKWFLAVINNKQAKDITVPLSFLGDKTYSCKSLGNTTLSGKINGGGRPTNKMIKVALKSGDGMVAIFEPM